MRLWPPQEEAVEQAEAEQANPLLDPDAHQYRVQVQEIDIFFYLGMMAKQWAGFCLIVVLFSAFWSLKVSARTDDLDEELESTMAELEGSACELMNLKAEKDAAKGTFFRNLNQDNMSTNSDKSTDKQKDLQDMESALKELLDQSACRVLELKRLHEERIDILNQLSSLQNTLKSIKSIWSSQAYLLLKDQLAKAKADIVQYQALHEKLQVQKDSLAWREKEMYMKIELLDFNYRSDVIADSRISELEKEIQKYVNEKIQMEAKQEEASREPRMKHPLIVL